jgi:hypothetical protein
MNEPAAAIRVNLRIPGQWSDPRELIERLPAGCRLTPEALILPDDTRIEFGAMGKGQRGQERSKGSGFNRGNKGVGLQ